MSAETKDGAETSAADIEAVCEKTQQLIGSTNYFAALQAAIENPPNTKDQELRNKAAGNVLAALALIKENQVEKLAADLTEDQRDTVLKYVFKGMAGGENCGALLAWHRVIVEKNGIGAIARAMTDRKI